jgi:hypothetical protein
MQQEARVTGVPTFDPTKWGTTLANAFEVIDVAFGVARVSSVVEIGAFAGELTEELLGWMRERRDGRVVAIDPAPREGLARLAERRGGVELVRERSREALRHIDVPDAVIIDGDHSYYTVSAELGLIAERTVERPLPLVILHDVLWPHGRRDVYFDPDDVPPEHRHPIHPGGGLFPGNPGVIDGGIPYDWPAAQEGGPRNGVLTAVEDFLADHDGLRLAIVPAFFGVGVMWSEAADWSAAMAEAMRPWDRNPLLERLEANRVFHLASNYTRTAELRMSDDERLARRERDVAELQSLLADQERVLRALLDSGAFTVIDWLSAVRHGRHGLRWREQVRDALGENGGEPAAR